MKSASALQRLKDARRASREQQQAPNHHSAAASDADNEAYMQEFNAAFQQLSRQPTQAAARHLSQAASAEPQTQHQQTKPVHLRQWHASQPSGMLKAATASNMMNSASPTVARSNIKADAAHSLTAGQAADVAPGWRTGPVDAAGERDMMPGSFCRLGKRRMD